MDDSILVLLSGILRKHISDTPNDRSDGEEECLSEVKNVCFKTTEDFSLKIDDYADLCDMTKANFIRHAISLAMTEVDHLRSSLLSENSGSVDGTALQAVRIAEALTGHRKG